jgi:hypothetical protein
MRGSQANQFQSGGTGQKGFFRLAEADAKRASALLESEELLNVSGDDGGKTNEREMAIKDFHTELKNNQCSWDFLIFRATRTASDVIHLRNSSKFTIALNYLHNLTKH